MSHASTEAKEPMGCWKLIYKLLLLLAEMTPFVYVAITGHTPPWLRVWVISYLASWLLAVIVTAITQKDKP